MLTFVCHLYLKYPASHKDPLLSSMPFGTPEKVNSLLLSFCKDYRVCVVLI